MDETNDVMKIEDAASYLKINPQTLRRFAAEGRIPGFRIGNRWRFRKDTLDAWTESQQNSQPSPVGEAGTTIVVVDDEQAVLDTVDRILGREGFRIETARGGAAALELMQTRVPDLVLLDLKMPGMDGPATLKEIRSRWSGVPVIIMTGYPDSDLMHRAMEYAPITLLPKPVRRHLMVAAVKQALGVANSPQ